MQRFRTLLAIGIAIVATFASPTRAAPTAVVADASDLAPGSSRAVTIYFLNETSHPVTFAAPATLPATIVFAGNERPVALQRIDSSANAEIAPRQFVAMRYQVFVPANIATHAALKLSRTLEAAAPVGATEAGANVGEQSGEVAKTTEPTSRPDASPTPRERTRVAAGLVEYRPLRFAAYEPIYFLIGPEEPNGKFQISFKYQFVPPESPVGQAAPWATGFHLVYTQLSFWDLEGESKPFFDNNYKPEILWLWDDIRLPNGGPISRLDFQVGVQHESNGRDGENSRSLNIAYIRPTVTFGDREKWFVSVAPRLFSYIGSDDDNQDLYRYRGYGDVKLVAGKADWWQVALIGRVGNRFDRGSLQVDVSYPLRKALFDSFDIYLHGQFFTGYGESLLDYNEADNNFRVGISLVR